MAFARQKVENVTALPLATSLGIQEGRYIDRFVRFEGAVADVFPDEIDAEYWFFVIRDNSGQIYAPVQTHGAIFHPQDYIDATVAFHGICLPTSHFKYRSHLRYIISINSLSDIRILSKPPNAPFNAPLLGDLDTKDLSPEEVVQLGRARNFGTILAVRQNHEALLQDADGRIMRLEFIEATPPACGASVEVVGQLETDISHINLSRCIWRPAPTQTAPTSAVRRVGIRDLIRNQSGRTIYKMGFHGQTIRLTGTVRSLPRSSDLGSIAYLETDGVVVPVDTNQFGSFPPGLEIGCVVSVTGVCWMDIDNWHATSVFPQTQGFTILPTKADDIVILSSPPWWTPWRLLVVIAVLLGLLIAASLWINALRRLSERRGQALFREQIDHVSAELRVNERTRLAVEIHDTISQNLTGVALEIDAEHYETAQRMLRSSRDELRNCLWDLRNDTLGASSVEEAIRLTLSPHLRGTRCLIRFPVPRTLFTDSTAHAILKIIRELTVNAIRHGKATEIRIAGSIEGGRLLFSVRDNGCGFDPQSAPGLADGHFGLQGIRERIAEFDGEIEIDSTPGHGTKVTLAIGITNNQGNKS